MAAISLCMVACNDDENNETNPVQNVAGTYAGYSEAVFQYASTPLVSSDETLTINANETATGADISYTSESFGEFTVNDATVTYADGNYTISGEGSTLMGMGGSASEYECTLSGTLNEAKNSGSFAFSVPSVMGGMTITFTLGDVPTSKLLAGTYEGWTNAQCTYFDKMQADGQSLALSANDDDTFTLSYTSDDWGEFSFDDVSVSVSGNVYTLSGEGTTIMGMNGNASEYPCSLSGTIDKDKENVTFVFTVPSVMGGLTITFTQGDAPATSDDSAN